MKNPLDHILGTYHSLRLMLCVLGFLMPLVLMFGGRMSAKIPAPTHSLSAYYHLNGAPAVVNGSNDYTEHADGTAVVSHLGTMRNFFVGFLFALGVLLFSYKGYSGLENWVLNVAGAAAWGVALIPMDWPPAEKADFSFSMHFVCAGVLFLCIAYVCIFRAGDTLVDPVMKKKYQPIYWWLGRAMLVFPIIAWVLNSLIGSKDTWTFWLEATGVWIFASYWAVKSRELRDGRIDTLAACGHLQQPGGAPPVFRQSTLQSATAGSSPGSQP